MHSLNKRPTKTLMILPLVLVLMLLFAACIGGGDDDDDSVTELDAGGVMSTTAPDDSGAAEAEDAYEVAGAPSADGEPVDGARGIQTSYVVNQMPLDRLIIRTVTIDLTVEDVAQGTIWLRDLAARKQGFVFSSNTYVRDESQFAQITLRVPSDQLDSTVQELREHDLVIQVDREESSSQDVSQEFVDNEARLEALEETQRRFMALLSEADNVEEILRIEAELTNIRSQIETIKGRQSYLEEMTAFSTVTITLHAEDADIEDLEEDDDDSFIARIFGDSWDSASGVIEGLLTGTITLAIIGLAALPFALVLYFAGRAVYRRAYAAWRGAPPVVTAEPAVDERAQA